MGLFPFIDSEALPMWIPTGTSLFILIWWSPGFWPAIFIAELVMGEPITSETLFEASANTLELALAAYVFLHVFKNRERLLDLSGMIGALAIGGAAMPVLAGGLLFLLHRFTQVTFIHTQNANILQWATGDYNGVLLTLPLLSGLGRPHHDRPLSRWRRLELAMVLAVLVLSTGFVFDAWNKWPALDFGNEMMGARSSSHPFWRGLLFALPSLGPV